MVESANSVNKTEKRKPYSKSFTSSSKNSESSTGQHGRKPSHSIKQEGRG